MKRASTWIAQKMSYRTEMPDSDFAKLEYGIRIILSEGSKFAVLCLFGILFGVVENVLVVIGTIMMVRTFTGGLHNSGYWSCLVHTGVLIAGVLALSRMVPCYLWESWVVYILSAGIYILLAPARNAKRGKWSKKSRNRRKFFSVAGLICTMIWFFITRKYEIIWTLYVLLLEFLLQIWKNQKQSRNML